MTVPMALEDLLHPFLGRYLAGPSWLHATAGRAYRMLPASMRMGKAYARFEADTAMRGAAATGAALAKLDTTLR